MKPATDLPQLPELPDKKHLSKADIAGIVEGCRTQDVTPVIRAFEFAGQWQAHRIDGQPVLTHVQALQVLEILVPRMAQRVAEGSAPTVAAAVANAKKKPR